MSSLGGKALLGWCECLSVGCACAFSVCAQRVSVSVWQRRGSRPSHARPAGEGPCLPRPLAAPAAGPQLLRGRGLSCVLFLIFCCS